jgi:protein-disulfide isomerase-like protein with CxxC motif
MGKLVRGWEKRDADAGAARAASQDRVARWLDALLLHTSGVEAPVDIAISHAAVDQSRRLIRSYRIAAVPPEPGELYSLAEEIAETIALDADDLGGHQRYQLVARCNGQEVGSTTVRMVLDAMPPAVDSEPATASGLVAQAQRHAEAAMRLMIQSQGAVVSSLTKRLVDQDALLDRLLARQKELMDNQDALLKERVMLEVNAEDRRAANELKAAKEVAEIQRHEKMWNEGVSMVKLLLPALVQHWISGKSGDPQDMTALLNDEFLKTFTDEQIRHICQRLPPPMVEAFLARVKQARAAQAGATPTAQGEASSRADGANSEAPLQPLEGDTKVGAAKWLKENLLPKLVERHRAGEPLVDEAKDGPFPYQLLRRLAVSTTEVEMQMILGAIGADASAALIALCKQLQIPLPVSQAGGAS